MWTPHQLCESTDKYHLAISHILKYIKSGLYWMYFVHNIMSETLQGSHRVEL